MFLHEAGEPGREYGKRPILQEKDANCPDCGRVHDIEVCPDCGSFIELGYGLGFGPGIGEYKFCGASCGWAWKRVDPEDE